MTSIIGAQLLVLAFFFGWERLAPATARVKSAKWDYWFAAIGLFALIWLRFILYLWTELPPGPEFISFNSLNTFTQGVTFYIVYSFGNYWFHRWKHSNQYFWTLLHKFHHSPAHMETLVAFFRHPLEIFANTIYLILVGKLLFGASAEVILLALTIEGCLETFHHANIKFPRHLWWTGYFIQTPPMHIVHHEINLHRYNYSPIFWDTLFGTVKVPKVGVNQAHVGFKNSHNIKQIFLLN